MRFTSWIKKYVIDNKTTLSKKEAILAACNTEENSYKIVFSKEIIKGYTYYFLALYENKKCIIKNYITEDDNFSNFKNNFMKQLIILKRIAKGEIIEFTTACLKVSKDDLGTNTRTNKTNAPIGSKIETKIKHTINDKRYKFCTNCIYVDMGSIRKPALKCNKRNCRLADKTEANWCKFYEK